MLAVHLLQSSLVFINTQLLQAVLRDPAWAGKLIEEDRRGLSPLFWFVDAAWPPRRRATVAMVLAGGHLRRRGLPHLAGVLAPFDLEHTFRLFKQVLGWSRPRLRDPAAADR